jgi:ubiquinone/menaquinone biosynthesis C-methylase UbiE
MHLIDKVRSYWQAEPCGTNSPELNGLTPYTKDWFELVESLRYQKEPLIHAAAQFTLHKHRKVLEIGLGLGTDHLQWARAGAEVYGVDLTQAAVDITSRRLTMYGFVPNVQTANAENLPFKNDSFDLVYSWGVIHHSENPQAIIDEIQRVLKPGGQVIAMFYSSRSLRVAKTWLFHGIMRGRFLSPKKIVWDSIESPGTKCYSQSEISRMFHQFENVTVTQHLTHVDLTHIPKCLHSLIPNYIGFYSVVKCNKGNL